MEESLAVSNHIYVTLYCIVGIEKYQVIYIALISLCKTRNKASFSKYKFRNQCKVCIIHPDYLAQVFMMTRNQDLTMKGRACSHQAYVTWELPNKTFLFVKIYTVFPHIVAAATILF